MHKLSLSVLLWKSKIKNGGLHSTRPYRWRQSATSVCELHCLPLWRHLYGLHDWWPLFYIRYSKGTRLRKHIQGLMKFSPGVGYFLHGITILDVKFAVLDAIVTLSNTHRTMPLKWGQVYQPIERDAFLYRRFRKAEYTVTISIHIIFGDLPKLLKTSWLCNPLYSFCTTWGDQGKNVCYSDWPYLPLKNLTSLDILSIFMWIVSNFFHIKSDLFHFQETNACYCIIG